MKRIIADIHTHTLVSGHAYGTIREMAQAASEKGLEVLGITEHAPGIPGTVDPFYYLNLKAIPEELYGVRIINGCEINVLNDGSLSLEEKYIERCIFVYKINDIEIRIILEENDYFGLWTNLSPATEDDVIVSNIDKLLETLPIIEELIEKIKK